METPRRTYDDEMKRLHALSGPWKDEPDRVEWRCLGFPCLIVRNNSGALCGYVGVPPAHPWHGKKYDEVGAEVHGGLTYSRPCEEGGNICDVAYVTAEVERLAKQAAEAK